MTAVTAIPGLRSSVPADDYSRRLSAWVELGRFSRGETQTLGPDVALLVPEVDLDSDVVRTALRRWSLLFARALREFAPLSQEVRDNWGALTPNDLRKIDDAIQAVEDGLNVWLSRAPASFERTASE